MSLNRLRDLAGANKAAIGTFVSMGNMSEVECLGYTGLDFVIIDTEHGPFDTETMMNLIRAAELVHLVPVVRLANVDHRDIQRAADCGAQAIILPCLRDLDDFKKAVAWQNTLQSVKEASSKAGGPVLAAPLGRRRRP